MKSEKRTVPISLLLPFEGPVGKALKIYLWRFVLVGIIFVVLMLLFWCLQVADLGLGAMDTDLFTLVWGTFGAILMLILVGVTTDPDRHVISVLGLRGWIKYNVGKTWMIVLWTLAITPAYLAMVLPFAPLDIELAKLSLLLQRRWYAYIGSMIDMSLLLIDNSGVRYEDMTDELRQDYRAIKSGKAKVKDAIIKNQKFLQRLNWIEQMRGERQRQDISELIRSLIKLFHSSSMQHISH